MQEHLKRLLEAVEKSCRVPTSPVAVRLAKDGETAQLKTKYPRMHLGHPVAACQAMTLCRTLGWSMALREEDHACPFPGVFLGHLSPEEFLKGETAAYYVNSTECAVKMEGAYPRWPLGQYSEVWLAPLSRCEFEPQVVVVYGNPAQILLLIQAANCSTGEGVSSFSFGRAGCAGWLAGVIQSGRCAYMIPGPGERVFAGTQDHEMSFAIPASRVEEVIDGLEYVRKQGMFRYPVPNLAVMGEPSFPDTYAALLRKK